MSITYPSQPSSGRNPSHLTLILRSSLICLLFVLSLSHIHAQNGASIPIDQQVVLVSNITLKSRSLDRTYLSVEQSEGYGARVRRSIGRPELRSFDPFLMLDEFRMNVTDQNSGTVGFPDHPHRGMQTVSFILPSSTAGFQHEDFIGNKGTLLAGSVQWMHAGKGILHSEMPFGRGVCHGLQLWVNLPNKERMTNPDYQELKPDQLPIVEKDGVTARIIAGKALDAEARIFTKTPMHYIHFQMKENTHLFHEIPVGWNAFIYSIRGLIRVGSQKSKRIRPHHTITLTSNEDENGIDIYTDTKDAEFVLLAGQKINEPVYQHGPFVMGNREEIEQTFRDYQYGQNGFEGAARWKSKIGIH
jgi:redox-sensitive bicupin YhaK (pirin superfamily)